MEILLNSGFIAWGKNGYEMKARLISFDGEDPVLDIRYWSPQDEPGKTAIKLKSREEIQKVIRILQETLKHVDFDRYAQIR
ncbi:MAG: hypothetical protein LBN31_08570 [Hungatella sp.]|jgi:hypothetical protein|nr:hypothetical protein [Hungatella sp.]